MKNWMETTDLKSSKVKYKTNWLRFRQDRTVTPDRIWIFTDGSTTGWHAATVIKPGEFIRQAAKKADFHASRNIAGELNGLLLGLEMVPSDSVVTIVHDFIGVGAWTIGAWEINSEDVRDKINRALKLIADKRLDVSFIHHGGHQDRKKKDRPVCHSDFTKWNCSTDRLCESKVESDTITSLVAA